MQRTDCKSNWTPYSKIPLTKDLDGELWDDKEWNYASIVGMLLYVSNNTRPDITYAVSQVARFTAAPRVSHAAAVKSIVRYLVHTKSKGLYFKPDGTYNMSIHCDANLAGMYGAEKCTDVDSAKSRMGYIIKFGSVPMVWKSQLISEICLSTAHSEYVALTSAVKAIIPIRETILDALKFFKLPADAESPDVYCKLF